MMTEAEALVTVYVADRKAKGIPIDRVPDPVLFEVGGASLYVRPHTPFEAAKLCHWFHADPLNRAMLPVAVFALSVCDEQGKLLFSFPEAVHAIATTLPAFVIDAVMQRVNELEAIAVGG